MRQKKSKQKEKFKPLSEASNEELLDAMELASYWLADQLEGRTNSGAFSAAFLGDEARLYFPAKALKTLKSPDCKWHWKEGTKLSTLVINVMRSDMAHELRRYIDLGESTVMPASSFERDDDDEYSEANSLLEVDPDLMNGHYDVQSDMEMLEELERYESLRDKGRHIARAAALKSGNPKLQRYAELVFEMPDYRAISKRMKITQEEVKELEAQLIVIFSKKK